ncbi:Spectrin alpha chain, non-erythrocytic 1 [Halocaridina rubra]|uniref:Spectrin alpha chain, non-erythrocytic 1 n=1 Tax=Halocaridina rubra TaxID=373956 RepID=A0AAN8WFS1_HALRR
MTANFQRRRIHQINSSLQRYTAGFPPESQSRAMEVDLLETADEIQAHRDHILFKYAKFQSDAHLKGEMLQDSRRFQYFKRDSQELESWIQEKLQIASDENFKDHTNAQAKIQKHQAFEAEVAANDNTIKALDKTGTEMIAQKHFASDAIRKTLDKLHHLWEQLLSQSAKKGIALKQVLELVQFQRKCNEVMYWINDKEAYLNCEEYGTTLEHVTALQRKYDEFEKDMSVHEYRISEVNKHAEKITQEGQREVDIINKHMRDLNEAWKRLCQLALVRKEKLFGALEIQRFNRDANETIAWINEKDASLQTEEYGRDMVSVQSLQRKHEAIELDLSALKDKESYLEKEATRLIEIHANEAVPIQSKLAEIKQLWVSLTAKAQERRRKLDDSHGFHAFLSDFRDHISWINDMKAIINADDIAKDLMGAEALLERHYERKSEIDARKYSLESISKEGEILIEKNHSAKEDIRNKLSILTQEMDSLLALWTECLVLYKQCLKLQVFYRDSEQVETWMARQETFLENEDLGDSIDSVEELIKKHKDFERSLSVQGENISTLDEFANKLIEGQHYAREDVAQRREIILKRRVALLDLSTYRRVMLDDSYAFQKFERDYEETKGWINEKLKIATDDSYLDPTNLVAKLQKHITFNMELDANKSRTEDIAFTGKELIDADHYAKERINDHKKEILQLWNSLEEASKSKGSKLEEASQEQQFIRLVEDLELWLSEVESQVKSEDYGKNLIGMQNLLKNHALLEADVASHKDRVDSIRTAAQQFIDQNHFDAEMIKEKQVALQVRYDALQEPMIKRKELLKEALCLYQLLRDIDDEKAWIREKETIANSANLGKGLIGIQNLIKKHQVLLAEISNHEHRIFEVITLGEKMLNDSHFAEENIRKSIKTLSQCWAELKEDANRRKQNLDDSLRTHQYYADANEAESWMTEKEPIAAANDYGKDEDSAEALLKKQGALMCDLEAFSSTIANLEEQAAECRCIDPVASKRGTEVVIATFDYKKRTPREISIKKNDVLTLLNTRDRDWWKVAIDDKQGYVPANYVKKVDADWVDSQRDCPDENMTASKQSRIREQYEHLMELARQRHNKLAETVQAYVLVREAAELSKWIQDKEQHGISGKMTTSLEEVEELQKNFDSFQDDMRANEERLADMNNMLVQLQSLGETEAAQKMQHQINELNSKWQTLQKMAQARQFQLVSENHVQRLNRDTDETKEWINEKDEALKSDDYGKDLPSVQALQRKHEGLERDMAALGDKIRQLEETGNLLLKTHPDKAEIISSMQCELQEFWTQVTKKANARREKLLDSYDFQRFLSNYRDLSSWITSMMGLVSLDELANDVTAAEALKERHQEYRGEIDARSVVFQNFELFGHQLIHNNHFASSEIQRKLEDMNEARQELERTWIKRKLTLDQCLELQVFLSDCEQAGKWMNSRKDILESDDADASSSDNVEILIKKHENIDKVFNAQEEKIAAIALYADQLLTKENYASTDIGGKKTQVLDRWQKLKQLLIRKRSLLGESQMLQQFSHDADEIENWIAEKLQVATEENFRDHTNIQSKHQKHQAFESEIAANADRVQAVLAMGQNLIDKYQCAGSEDAVKQRIKSISKRWDLLTRRTEEKFLKLKEANKQKFFFTAVKDLEFWLGEVESLLTNEEVGKDLVSVQNLMKKHRLLEADIEAHEDKIKDISDLADNLIDGGQLDNGIIHEKKQSIKERYERLEKLAAHHQSELQEALILHQFFRDIADEESWIKEKMLLMASDDYGRDITGVQNLRKKHRRLEIELTSHESSIESVQQNAEKLMGVCTVGVHEIVERLQKLSETWSQLKALADERGQKLNESLIYQQFIAKFEEEEVWISERMQLLSVLGYGNNMAVVKGLLKKHESFEIDFALHRDRCEEVTENGNELIANGNHNKDRIQKRCQSLSDKLDALNNSATQRKRKLEDNVAFVQFKWKADVVESWIKHRSQAMSKERGRDLPEVLMLLAEQETYNTGLHAFGKEGVLAITSLKNQLVSRKHEQSESIIKRHDDVIAHWEKLCHDAYEYKSKLQETEKQYRDIEDLYMLFAKKASAFNSWFENAEEDLTDPVRCNSTEEIMVLCNTHDKFKTSLYAAEEDYNALIKIAEELKTYKVGPNPYTWFTMESLQETWNTLHLIIKERDEELANEKKRQAKNETLRKEFAKYVTEFYRQLTEAR